MGAIVGGVVGGVGGALVLALAGFLLYKCGRRRSPRGGRGGYAPQSSVDLGDEARFEIDEAATPYVDSVPLTAAGSAGAGAAHGGPIAARTGPGGRPVLPPLVTETKHALDSPHTSSSHLTPNTNAGRPDMLLSPGGRSESEWTHGTGHTFGPRDSVPLTPLERETKAAIPPSPGGAGATLGGMGTFGGMGASLGAIDARQVVDGAEGKSRPAPGAPAHSPRRPPRRVAQEEDAGSYPQPAEAEGDLELVPPSYNPEWARERPAASQSAPSPTTQPSPTDTRP